MHFIIQNGIDERISDEEARIRMIYNCLIAFSTLILSPFPLIFKYLGLTPGGYFICLSGFISIIVPFFLHRFQYYAMARLIGIYLGIITFSLGYIFWGLHTGFIYGICVVAALPIMYFNKPSHQIAAFLSCCVLALLIIFTFWDLSPIYGEPPNSLILFGIISFFVTLVLISYFISSNWINKVYMNKNAALIEALMIRNEELKNFSYSTSHDLKQPIQTILSFVTLFKEKKGDRLDEAEKQYLHFIQESGNRLEHLINALLEHSILGQKENFEPVDCNQVVGEIQADLVSSISKNKCHIYKEALPTLVANREELRVVFQNLLSNAIKFKQKDKEPIVNIQAKDLGQYWKFCVRDNGVGIEEHLKERIFQLFQVGHDNKHIEGTGIGLANCKKIINLHGGEIWVESSLGQGSYFYFTIKKLKPSI